VRVAVVITIGVAIIAAEVGAVGWANTSRGLRLNDNNLLLAGALPRRWPGSRFWFGLIEKRFDTSIQRQRDKIELAESLRSWLVAVSVIGFASWRALAASIAVRQRSRGHVSWLKDFTESNLLAEIVAQMLEAQNVEVDRELRSRWNLAHSALLNGDIDLYPGIHGYGVTAILHHPPITDRKSRLRTGKARVFKPIQSLVERSGWVRQHV
jgi:hypothetical protein